MRRNTSRSSLARVAPLSALPLFLGCSTERAEAPPEPPAPPAMGPLASTAPPRARPLAPIARAEGARIGSAIALGKVQEKRVLFVADEDDSAVRVVDLETRAEVSTTPLEGAPSKLVIDREGFLYAALRYRNEIVKLEAKGAAGAPLEERARIPTATEPSGLAITPDDATLLVTSAWGHELAAFSIEDRTRRFAVDLPREPRAVVVSEDGARAYVSHVTGSTVSVVPLGEGDHAVTAIPLKGFDAVSFSPCSEGGMMSARVPRSAVHGFALAQVGDRVLAPMVMARSISGSGYGGGGVFPPEELGVVSIGIGADPKKPILRTREYVGPVEDGKKVGRASVSVDRSPCLLPRAAAASPGRSSLLVACVGTDEVIELEANDKKLMEAELGRWKVPAGPAGVAVDDAAGEAYVWSQFAREVSVIALGGEKGKPIHAIALPPKAPLKEELALGRRLFHAVGDRRISSDGRVCASCHPDGRDDGLVWLVASVPLQTPMLAGRIEGTAPYGWRGDGGTVKDHLTVTFQRLSGVGLPPHELEALIAYVMSLRAPEAANRGLDPKVARGREVFTSDMAMCTICHVEAKRFTDGTLHDVGAGAVDTPSLRFLAGTAPYFHDGRYPTLRDLLQKSDGKMGQVKHLSQGDLEALEAYLMSL